MFIVHDISSVAYTQMKLVFLKIIIKTQYKMLTELELVCLPPFFVFVYPNIYKGNLSSIGATIVEHDSRYGL